MFVVHIIVEFIRGATFIESKIIIVIIQNGVHVDMYLQKDPF